MTTSPLSKALQLAGWLLFKKPKTKKISQHDEMKKQTWPKNDEKMMNIIIKMTKKELYCKKKSKV
jgi:hypothetical protein